MTYQILVAEDEIECRVVLKEAIADIDSSTEIVTVGNGSEAVEQATSRDFDLIVMDLHVEEMSGIEALKVIHMSEPDLPILVAAETDDDDKKTEALTGGASIILTKPLDLSEFTSAVRKLLGIRIT